MIDQATLQAMIGHQITLNMPTELIGGILRDADMERDGSFYVLRLTMDVRDGNSDLVIRRYTIRPISRIETEHDASKGTWTIRPISPYMMSLTRHAA